MSLPSLIPAKPMPERLMRLLPWVLLALPALYQLGLLWHAIAGRVGYPFDLEWMEGGLLHHAQRIQHGEGIYAPPSVDFVPYLYTPLYPALIALLGHIFGIGYALGRWLSILSLVGIGVVSYLQLVAERHRHFAWGPVVAGGLLGLALFAATYPFVEGWFDLVRADTLFLFMITAGLSGLSRWSKSGEGLTGHARVAAGGAILALAFFCKQTGFIYVGFGGALVLVLSWRRLPAYVGAAGIIGLGLTKILNATTHGWFWIYISKIHRAHDFNWDRVWQTPKLVLWHFPAMTIVIGVTLIVVLVASILRRGLVTQARPFLLWTATYVVSGIVGAIGWGTEFAHFNAFMPAMLHGALAAGAAVPAIVGCFGGPSGDRTMRGLVAGIVIAAPLSYTCFHERWKPKQFIPTRADWLAGDKLISHLATIDGDIWMPSHPWYPVLAGKPATHVHRMGVKDVTWRQPQTVVEGLRESLATHRFSALVLDDRDVNVNNEVPGLAQYYRAAQPLPPDERPRLYTGAKVVPATIWLPVRSPAPPPGATGVADFEASPWAAGWVRSGPAWGNGPEDQPLQGEALVMGATGLRYATSMHGGDVATGRMTSPPFAITAPTLVLHLGGDTDATKCRVEVWVDGAIVGTASAPKPGGAMLREVKIDVTAAVGKDATLVLVDDQLTGHLTVDDVYLRR